MVPEVSFATLAFLCAAAFIAGFVDAIAGGAGLITLPILMSHPMSAAQALGTNKGQALFGATGATIRFFRAGWVNWRQFLREGPMAFAASLVGAYTATQVPNEFMKKVALAMLFFAASFVIFRPNPKVAPGHVRFANLRSAALVISVGFYDGFFGPGTGTLLIVGFVAFCHLTYKEATARGKVVNLASNGAAFLLFQLKGVILWKVALPMGIAQLFGSTLGASLAIKRGEGVVRLFLVLVSLALMAKLALSVF